MKKTVTRFTIFLLILLTCFSTACAKPNNGKQDTTAASTSTTAPDTTVLETEALPEVWENANFDGYKCTILLGLTTLGRNEFITTDSTTVFGSAISKRNSILADNFGIIIETEEHFTGGFSANTVLAQQYASGDTDYDFSIARILDAAKLTVNGHLYDLKDLEHLDVSKPWWDQTVVNDSTVAGSLYFVSGDISTLVNDFVCCIAFDKETFKQVSGEESSMLYNAVEQGTWTIDMLNRYSSLVSEDLNNDNILDSRDRYGLTVWDSRVIATVHGAGGKVVTLNDNGEMELTLNTERNATAVEDFITMCMNQYCLNMVGMTGGVDWKTIFANGQALFTMASFNSLEYFRNLKTDYGILPQPKSFADQESYHSSIVSTHACFLCVPLLQEDAGRTGAIIEILGYLGKDIITPAYYEKTLNGTFIRDDESAVSIDICFATKVVDLGDYFSIGGYYSSLAQLLNNKNATGFAAMYAAAEQNAKTSLASLNEQLAKLNSLK